MAIIYTKYANEMLIARDIRKALANRYANDPDHILPGDYDRKVYLKDFGTNYLKLVVSEEENNYENLL